MDLILKIQQKYGQKNNFKNILKKDKK